MVLNFIFYLDAAFSKIWCVYSRLFLFKFRCKCSRLSFYLSFFHIRTFHIFGFIEVFGGLFLFIVRILLIFFFRSFFIMFNTMIFLMCSLFKLIFKGLKLTSTFLYTFRLVIIHSIFYISFYYLYALLKFYILIKKSTLILSTLLKSSSSILIHKKLLSFIE